MPILLRRISLKLLKLKNSVLTFATLIFVVICSTIAFFIEPETFETWFNALYWVLTTMATVGYGDYYAHTFAGKVFSIFLYVFGIGLLSLIISKVVDGISNFHRGRESGKLKYHGKNHIIMINWSKKAYYAIEELLSSEPRLEVVIIDESDKHPYDHAQVHFVCGDPSSEEALLKANLAEARAAIIFADSRIDEPSLVDGKSLLVASSIESIASNVHTTVEIMLEKHIQNFKHNHVNEFILSHDAVSRLAARSALNEGSIDIFTQLLSNQYGPDIRYVPLRSEWKTYLDAFHDLLDEGATLISDRNDMNINRKLHDPIPKDARLFIVCEPDAYDKIIEKSK